MAESYDDMQGNPIDVTSGHPDHEDLPHPAPGPAGELSRITAKQKVYGQLIGDFINIARGKKLNNGKYE